MDEAFIERLKDYFSPCELVEFLEEEISVEALAYQFEDIIIDNQDMLQEYMDHGR